MATNLDTEIDQTLSELIGLLGSFDHQQLNTVPFEGSWTAGQLGRHMIKANSGFLSIINGPVKDTARNSTSMVEMIRKDFLDFSTKTTSPDFVVPENIEYQQQDLLPALENIKTELVLAIQQLDLTKTCLAFELPVYGALTRVEAVNFVLYHTKRHIRQLKNIQKTLAA